MGPSHHYNGNPFTGKMALLYQNGAQPIYCHNFAYFVTSILEQLQFKLDLFMVH